MATTAALSRGSIAALGKGAAVDAPVVQVTAELVPKGERFKTMLHDGSESMSALLASQLSDQISAGAIKQGTLLRLNQFVVTDMGNAKVLMVSEVTVLGDAGEGAGAAGFAFPAVAVKPEAGASTPPNKLPTAAMKENVPGASPGAAPSPSDDHKSKAAKLSEGMTPGGPGPRVTLSPPGWGGQQTPTAALTPPSVIGKGASNTPGASVTPLTKLATAPEKKQYHKLDQLHPYETSWTIKVKVSRKGPLRTGKSSVFSIDMVDDQGRAIQGTFWRGQAERYHDVVQEGKVYVIHKFQVKVANKAYNNTNNDYEISFTDQTDVMEAADQDTSAMVEAVNVVPITQLPKHVTRKAPVDIMGVVVGLGSVGTIKRKTSGEELSRRDVTLVDQGGKSVVLTLWGETAARESEMLEGWQSQAAGECLVLQCTACRVTEFNGCSLSALPKSTLTVDPDSDTCRSLKDWWQAEGHGSSSSFQSVGQDAAGARGSGGAGGGATARVALSELAAAAKASTLPPPDAKATYSEVMATVGTFRTENMWYLAHPETGKKVTQQGDGTYASDDGKTCDAPEHRYVASARVLDFSGDLWVNVFNAEAEAMLGISAAKLAEIKEGDGGDDKLAATVKGAQYSEWVLTIASRTQEYNGDRRMRHRVQSCKQVDWAAECKRLVEVIAKY